EYSQRVLAASRLPSEQVRYRCRGRLSSFSVREVSVPSHVAIMDTIDSVARVPISLGSKTLRLASVVHEVYQSHTYALSARTAQELLRLLGQLADDFSRGQDSLHGADRLAGIEGHRTDLARCGAIGDRGREARNRGLGTVEVDHLADDLPLKRLGRVDGGAQDTMRRFRPANVERASVDAILRAGGDQCLGVDRMHSGLFGGDETRAHPYTVCPRRERRRHRPPGADSPGREHRYFRHGFEHLAEQIE